MKLRGIMVRNKFRALYTFVDEATGKRIDLLPDSILANVIDAEYVKADPKAVPRFLSREDRTMMFELALIPVTNKGKFPLCKGRKWEGKRAPKLNGKRNRNNGGQPCKPNESGMPATPGTLTSTT